MLLTYNVYRYILHWKKVVEKVFNFALISFLRYFYFYFVWHIYQIHINSNKKYMLYIKKITIIIILCE